MGFPGAQTVKIFPDNNLPLPSNFEKVRFINASPDAPPLDVLINDVKAVTGLASGTASIYFPLAVNTYTYKFVDPVTGTVSPTLTVAVLTNSIYTVYVLGPKSDMTAIFVIDR
jgi:hypothetical protein